MAKTKNRIKKMNFQKQSREYEPLSEEHKYIIQMAGYKKELTGQIRDEDVSRTEWLGKLTFTISPALIIVFP